MNSKFKVTIPKPCHENWNAMTPKEKGRFCSSCAKTVVDFTKKTTQEIQEYLAENRNQKVCGHFYKKQLDSITIEIPQVTFQQQLSFQKIFVLALFFVMGTTLFSCQYSDGKKQKIENIVIQDSVKIIHEELGFIFPTKEDILKQKDSLIFSNNKDSIEIVDTSWCPTKDSLPESIVLGGLSVEGEIDLVEKEIEDDVVFGYVVIDKPPRFKESKKLSNQEAKKDFEKRMREFVQRNFNEKLTQCLDLKEGKYKMYAQFTIDKKGNVTGIKVKAPHPKLKKEIARMLQKLPQFIPGEQRNKPVKIKYNLPIAFVVE